MTARVACSILACALLDASASAQQAPVASHVTGVVVDAQTDVAVRRARVTVETASPLAGASVLTDEKGLFSLDVPGDANLTIAKAGYARETVKVARPRGTEPVELHVALKRGAAITGRVVDGFGVPLTAAVVAARAVSAAPAATALTAQTDDLGEFRFGGLTEGEFHVAAVPGVNDGNPSRRAVEDVDAANAAAAAAAPVRVRSGDSVDIGELVVTTNQFITAGGRVGNGVSETAVVTGQVTDSRGRPMKVVVRLTRYGSAMRMLTSDEQGRFTFKDLPAGSYIAEASRPGGSSVQFGQRAAGQPGTPIDVRDGATVGNIDFVLTGGTAITGTISDEYGEPVEGAFVRALQIRRIDNRLAAISAPGVQTRTSDDRGTYRIFGLLPGRYLVVADMDAPTPLVGPIVKNGYAPIYYSGAANVANALPVVLDKGDATGIDLAFHREPTTRVTGTALDSGGRPITGAVLLGVSQRSGGIMLEPKVAAVAPDGTFAFESVSPGDYVLQSFAAARGGRPTPEPGKSVPPMDREFGMQYVTITNGEPPPPILLRTSPGATLHGRIRVDGNASAVPQSLVVYAFPTDFDSSSVIGIGAAGFTKRDDGSFDVTGVTGPRRMVMMSSDEGWYLKDARVRGVDALDTPFDFGLKAAEFDDIDVIVSPRAATISGTVVRPGGEAIARYAVVLFSTDSGKWYRNSQSLKMARPSQNGEFRIGGLPPGSYDVLAVSDGSDLITSFDWQDPMSLEGLRSRATRVTVGEGETRTMTLRLTSDR